MISIQAVTLLLVRPLTTSIDNFTGTQYDDTFNANLSLGENTLQAFDSLNGAGGTDTLNAQLTGVSVTPAQLANIEIVNVAAISDSTLNLANAGQVTNVGNLSSTGVLTVTNIAAGADLAVTNTGHDTYFEYASGAGTESVDLTITNATGMIDIDGAAGGIETVNITSLGTVANSVNLDNETGTTTITVSGNNSLTLTGIANVTNLNASGFTGNLTAQLVANGTNLTLVGGSGNDTLSFDAGTSGQILGNAGNDSITVVDGDSILDGGIGNDTIYGGSGNDAIYAGAGNDTVSTGNGNNYVTGDAGNDSITAGNGNDNINAGADNDLIIFADGNLTSNDSVDGGSGTNTLQATAANLATASTSQLTNVANIQTLQLSTALAGQTININNVDEAINTINVDGGYGTLNGLNAGGTTLNLTDALAGGTLTVADDTTATGETLTIVKNYAVNEDAFGGQAITATGIETLVLNTGSTAVATTQSTGTVTLTGEAADSNLAISVTGSNEVSLGAVTTASTGLLSIDVSGLTAQASGVTATVAAPVSAGTVSITGSAGNDVLNGDADSSNTIRGGAGVDSIVGGSAADSIDGNEGNDSIWGGGGNDTLKGGAGNDSIHVGIVASDTGYTGNVSIDGGEGNDVVYIANTLNVGDTIDGGTGTLDTLSQTTALIAATTTVSNFEVLELDAAMTQDMSLYTTNTGWTAVCAATGNNAVSNAGAAVSNVYLDDSVGTFTLSRAAGVTGATLTAQAWSDEDTTFALVDNSDTTVNFAQGGLLLTNTADDELTVNSLTATSATSVGITGGQKTAITVASNGFGTAATTVVVNASTATGTVNFDGHNANANTNFQMTGSSTAASSLYGAAGNDVITLGNAGSGNYVSTGNGNNSVTGGTGADSILGGTGNDTITGNGGNDTVNSGASGNDSITLGSGNDSITSGSGNDTITSGAGNDTISSGAGNDVISSGAGSDTITGGAGSDTVTLSVDSTGDRVVQGLDDSVATTANTLSGAVAAGQTLTFGSGLDVVQNFQATGTGYDTVAVTVTGAPTTMIGATYSSLLPNKTYYLSGNYNTLTGIFTITAAGVGADTLIVQTGASATDLSTNTSALLLQGVVSSDLSANNFVSPTGVTATYAGTTYSLSGTPIAAIAMAADGTITGDTVTYIGTFSQTLVTSIDASGISGGLGATINVTGATSGVLASVTGTTGSDLIIEASEDFGAGTSVINGNGGTDTVRFTTFGSATIYGATGSHQWITDVDNIQLTAGATSLTLDSTVNTAVNVSNNGASSAATVNLGTGAAHTYTSGSTGVDTVTLGLSGQTATFTENATNNVIKGAVAGSNVNLTGTGTNTLTIKSAAGNATAALDSLAANYTGTVAGTNTLNLITAATATTGAVTTGILTGIDTLNVAAVGANTAVTLGDTTGLTTIAGDTTNYDVTYNLSVAQLAALTNVTSAASGHTFTVAATATTGGAVHLDTLTYTTANVDSFDFSLATSAVTVYADATDITASLVGSAASDTLNIGTAVSATTLNGVSAFETINLSGGANSITTQDTLVASGATLNVNASSITGALTFDGALEADGKFNVTGSANNDNITGGAGADTIIGGSGSDTLSGGAGNDNIQGGINNDQINGGLGSDTIATGTGADLLSYTALTYATGIASNTQAATTNWVDTIADFDVATDMVKFSAGDLIAGTSSGFQVTLSDVGGGSIATGDSASVHNVTVNVSEDLHSGSANVLKFTSTTATSFASAIGTAVITTGTLSYNTSGATEGLLVEWYDSANSQAVLGYAEGSVDTTHITNASNVVEIARVGISAADFTTGITIGTFLA